MHLILDSALGEVYEFLLEQVKGSEIEDDYKEFLIEKENSYYFEIVRDKEDLYAVAFDYSTAMFAIEVNVDYLK